MNDLFEHLPFVLVVFFVLLLGATGLAAGIGVNGLATFLAPILWLGLYTLGPHRAAREE